MPLKANKFGDISTQSLTELVYDKEVLIHGIKKTNTIVF
jgi:hypothetical protein